MRHDNSYYHFLASVLRGSIPHATDFQSTDWSWDEFIRIASDETVISSLASRLRDTAVWGAFPREITDFLDAYVELNADRNRQLQQQIERVAGLLNERGIEPLLLKGSAYLLGGIYRQPADRFNLDIDLFVPAPDVDTAVSVIRQLGFLQETTDPVALAAHHLPAFVQGERIPMELHSQLGTRRCRRLLPTRDIYARSQRLKRNGVVLRLPSPTDMMVHLIAHSQIHHGAEQKIWPPLRAQYDLVLLRNCYGSRIDWTDVRERFKREGFLHLLEMHLLQITATFKQTPPIPIRRSGLNYLRWGHRQILWRFPELRFVDPIFFFSAVTNVRPSLGQVVKGEGGVRFLFTPQFAGRVYQKVVNSFRH